MPAGLELDGDGVRPHADAREERSGDLVLLARALVGLEAGVDEAVAPGGIEASELGEDPRSLLRDDGPRGPLSQLADMRAEGLGRDGLVAVRRQVQVRRVRNHRPATVTRIHLQRRVQGRPPQQILPVMHRQMARVMARELPDPMLVLDDVPDPDGPVLAQPHAALEPDAHASRPVGAALLGGEQRHRVVPVAARAVHVVGHVAELGPEAPEMAQAAVHVMIQELRRREPVAAVRHLLRCPGAALKEALLVVHGREKRSGEESEEDARDPAEAEHGRGVQIGHDPVEYPLGEPQEEAACVVLGGSGEPVWWMGHRRPGRVWRA